MLTETYLDNSMHGSMKGWRIALPTVAVLIAQIGLYLWMAPRGFEFTDESYYYLSYLHWREFYGSLSFFGAYFEWPFRWLNQSIAAIRAFSLALLLVSSAFFSCEMFRYFARQQGMVKASPALLLVLGVTASTYYFTYLGTLRAPSYNLLVLCAMLVSTGLLLRTLDAGGDRKQMRIAIFAYGIAIGACGLAKASSGLLLVVCHALFFAIVNRDWRLRNLTELLLLSLSGVLLNFVALHLAFPQWADALREGIAVTALDQGHGLLNMVNGLRWDIQRLRPMLPWAIGVGLLFALAVRIVGPTRRLTLSVLISILVGGCAATMAMKGLARLWLPTLGWAIVLLWSVDALNRKPFRFTSADTANLASTSLLLALPIVFSFGTNMPVLEHSEKAAVFVVMAASLQLFRLWKLGFLATSFFVVCLTVLCLPALNFQLRAAFDRAYTYRQLSSLGEQIMPVQIGATDQTLLVDVATRDTLRTLIQAARGAGFKIGDAVIDFTGDGPGLVFALGGRPVGTPWLIGGYSHSEVVASRLMSQVPTQVLRDAWLLTSDNNPRAIANWRQLLDARVGPDAYELVAGLRIRAAYSWGIDPPENINLQVWKPRTAPHFGVLR